MKDFDYESIKINGLNLTKRDNDFNNRRSKINLWIKEIQQMAKKTFHDNDYVKQIETDHMKYEKLIDENVAKYNDLLKKEGPYTVAGYFGESESSKLLNVLNARLNEEVFRIIEDCSIIDTESEKKHFSNSVQNKSIDETSQINENVFVVHGHNNEIKECVARVVTKLKLNPIILHENPNSGNTIIEKFEEFASKASFAIIILSDDDTGKSNSETDYNSRARQNVILEMGYFMGKLGRNRVFILKNGNIEEPSDVIGIVYNNYDSCEGVWRNSLVREMKKAGLNVDANNIL